MRACRLTMVALGAGCMALMSACAAADSCPAPPLTTADRCVTLVAHDLIDMRIVTAELVRGEADVPAHCRVTGVIETEINFELLLPVEWNGRMVMGGSGGFGGSVQNQAMAPIYAAVGGSLLIRGFATVGTDTGHARSEIAGQSDLNSLERQRHLGYRAVHLTAEAAKSVISHYYDEIPRYSYFVGCSWGARGVADRA